MISTVLNNLNIVTPNFQAKYFENYIRHLDGDDVIIEICQETIGKISGRGRYANGDRDPNSPTASVSAHSMSSVWHIANFLSSCWPFSRQIPVKINNNLLVLIFFFFFCKCRKSWLVWPRISFLSFFFFFSLSFFSLFSFLYYSLID